MKTSLLLLSAITLVPPTFAQWDDHPQTHTEYDWQSGNRYRIEHHDAPYEKDTHVKGYNYNTGSSWDTTIDNDGDMRGRDADGNSWKYDKSSSLYQNYGTGQTCIGRGAARTCF